MVKKPFKGNYLTFEVRVSYDENTDSIHLTSKDKDIPTTNGFHLVMNSGKDAEYALRTLLEQRGMIPEERYKYIPSPLLYAGSPSHGVWDRFPLGIHSNGKEAIWDSSTSPNVLIIGPTGSGKSVIGRNILFHCIQNSEHWRVLGIDLKQVELTPYKKHQPVVMEVATTLADSVETLRQARAEMMVRYEEMEELGINNFRDMDNPPKSLMVVIDEVNTLLAPVAGSTDEAREENKLQAEARKILLDISRLGRAAGVQLVLSTQQLDENILGKELILNCTTHIASGRLDSEQSKALLGNNEATRLNGAIKGRGYVQHHGKGGADFQGYFSTMDYLDEKTT